ncbi:type II pantothenate kinase [Gorillibacterium timonense]|uniref:type II pantothenate kinase n=1 Tax=Gorillibacterium timonense TaxID=1689269 RepID=UPI00071C9D13|nr:type II pantothenate kinase [Gorillibacterium timonense]
MSESKQMSIGVDAGGTLIKIAYSGKHTNRGAEPETMKIPTSRIREAADWIARHPEAKVCLTGGKSRVLTSLLQRETSQLGEFDATVGGALYLLKRDGVELDSFILTNAGTGTSVHHVASSGSHRIIGTGVGGGTVMGLSALLTGESDFDSIVKASADGDRERVDLLVSHIYEGAIPPIPGDLTASNFGYVLQSKETPQKADVLASVLGLVGETITTVSVMAAALAGTNQVVYAGSLFDVNPPLTEIVARYTRIRECEPVMLANGGFCGAIGAWLTFA